MSKCKRETKVKRGLLFSLFLVLLIVFISENVYSDEPTVDDGAVVYADTATPSSSGDLAVAVVPIDMPYGMPESNEKLIFVATPHIDSHSFEQAKKYNPEIIVIGEDKKYQQYIIYNEKDCGNTALEKCTDSNILTFLAMPHFTRGYELFFPIIEHNQFLEQIAEEITEDYPYEVIYAKIKRGELNSGPFYDQITELDGLPGFTKPPFNENSPVAVAVEGGSSSDTDVLSDVIFDGSEFDKDEYTQALIEEGFSQAEAASLAYDMEEALKSLPVTTSSENTHTTTTSSSDTTTAPAVTAAVVLDTQSRNNFIVALVVTITVTYLLFLFYKGGKK